MQNIDVVLHSRWGYLLITKDTFVRTPAMVIALQHL